MRVIFIYNQENLKEKEVIERAKKEILNYIEEIECIDFNLVREQFKIRTTPALIIIRDDLQGEHLLEEDMVNNQLRVTAELLKVMEEEDRNIHEMETYRIDYLVNKEATEKIDEITLELLDNLGV